MARILIVDDDAEVRGLVSEALRRAEYDVIERPDGRSALEVLEQGGIDLAVLDLGLPGVHGLDLLSELRRNGGLPVIILSGRGEESDRILGLKLGADDYLAKPFSPRELVARVESVLRRTRPPSGGNRYDYSGLVVDTATREVSLHGRPVELTIKEFDLLAHFAANPRRVHSREDLLRAVWDSSAAWQHKATVTEHVRRVRLKIEDDPDDPRWIKTVRGIGYRFDG